MQVFAIKFADGTWATNQYWREATDAESAKKWSKIGLARGMITRRSKYHERWKTATIVAFDLVAVDHEIAQLGTFYQTDTIPGLINAQQEHILQLQAELRKYKPKQVPFQMARAG